MLGGEENNRRSEAVLAGVAKARAVRQAKLAAMTDEERTAYFASNTAKARAAKGRRKLEWADTEPVQERALEKITPPAVERTPADFLTGAEADKTPPRKRGRKPGVKYAGTPGRPRKSAADPAKVEALRGLLGDLYGIDDVAVALDTTARTVQSFIKSGQLRAVKMGGEWKTSVANLRRFIDGE
ncbi:MAG: hypothetical protein LBS93_00715 [Synergistaceae bacterium]|jgi:hypothetical protein|nr:hypothetical protein [Synergistaceae bacterium]